MTTSQPTNATLANVASSATNVNIFAAAGDTNGRIIYNDSSAILYIKFGATASTTSYTMQIAAGASYTFPTPMYAGNVDGIWASANGFARTTWW